MLTQHDLQLIGDLFDKKFDEKFDAAFDRKFDEKFDAAFDRKFDEKFYAAFDRTFDEKISIFGQELFDAINMILDPLISDVSRLERDNCQMKANLSLLRERITLHSKRMDVLET